MGRPRRAKFFFSERLSIVIIIAKSIPHLLQSGNKSTLGIQTALQSLTYRSVIFDAIGEKLRSRELWLERDCAAKYKGLPDTDDTSSSVVQWKRTVYRVGGLYSTQVVNTGRHEGHSGRREKSIS